jgi:hypothetical protein
MANNDSIDSANIPPPLSHGGTGAQLVASNGGILYTDATKAAVLAATSTGNQPLLSGASGAPGWSTATYPGSTTINQLLYSSANNTITGLTTGNNGVLVTSAGGVPSISSTLPSAVLTNVPGRLVSFQVFTTGTGATYTKPAGVSTLLVEGVGGGGGGGGAAASAGQSGAGGGGGSSGYFRHLITSAAATYTYTVGAAGAAGASGANAGGAGTNTTFSTLTATAGGGGGAGSSTASIAIGGGSGATGSASGANIVNISGQYGNTGLIFGAAGVGIAIGGAGANSYFGQGANQISQIGGSQSGSAASIPGSGGSGGSSAGGSGNITGGAGAAGLIVVWEFT